MPLKELNIDARLVKSADRRLRTYGSDVVSYLNSMLLSVVAFDQRPQIDSSGIPCVRNDLELRVERAVAAASVTKGKDGAYHAVTPLLAGYWSDGATRKAALEDLRENAYWLLADPIQIPFQVGGRTYVAAVRAEREGGYWAEVPELPGALTDGADLDELRRNLVEVTELMLEAKAS